MKHLIPVIKWPGGKRSLLSQILPLVGEIQGRYFEPFLGGAAVFFSLQSKKSFLSDKNGDLINAYIQIRDNCNQLICLLDQLKNTEKDYYEIRSRAEIDPLRKAARFLYLTALSFNGIYRVNKDGFFNVPYGFKTKKRVFEEAQLRLVSKRLSGVGIRCCDFEDAVKKARQGDTIYFDPPYTVAHGNNGFLKYNERIFSWDDQVRLERVARTLSGKGCRVFVSNAYHPSLEELYSEFEAHEIKRPSLIAASGSHRGVISEYIFTLEPQITDGNSNEVI